MKTKNKKLSFLKYTIYIIFLCFLVFLYFYYGKDNFYIYKDKFINSLILKKTSLHIKEADIKNLKEISKDNFMKENKNYINYQPASIYIQDDNNIFDGY